MSSADGHPIDKRPVILRVLGALTIGAGALGLVVAVPWVLTTIGGAPWTWAIPSWNDLYWAVRQGNISSSAIITVLAAVAWLAWIDLVWSIVWEFVVNVPRLARGQAPRPTPVSAGPVERLARRIVLSVLAMTTVISGTASATVAAPNLAAMTGPRAASDRALVSVDHPVAVEGFQVAVSPATAGACNTNIEHQVWVVERGDTLWDIAEMALGDGARVDDLIVLNQGLDDVSRLVAGQRIILPADAHVVERPASTDIMSSPPTAVGPLAGDRRVDAAPVAVHIVEPGESLWSIAADEFGDGFRWNEIYDANAGREFADGRRLVDPDLIQPGWDLALGPTTPDVDEEPPAPAAPSLPVTIDKPLPPPALESPTEFAPPEAPWDGWFDEVHAAPSTPAMPTTRWIQPNRTIDTTDSVGRGGAGFGAVTRDAMLAAGVLTLLGVRRRRRLRAMRPRSSQPPTSIGAQTTEQSLRQSEPGGRLARLDIAVRAATMPLIERGCRIMAAVIDADGQLRLKTDRPTALDPPWTTVDGWLALSPAVPLEMLAPLARQAGAACPTMVQLGVDGDGGAVFVDLEACEAIEVEPADGRGDQIVTAITATLATSTMAEVCTLITVGIDSSATFGHPGAVAVADADEAIEYAAAAVGSTIRAGLTTFELRGRGTSGEVWEPAVVLVSSDSPPVRLPSDRRGLAIVASAPLMGPSQRFARHDSQPGMWRLAPLDLVVDPVSVDADQLEKLNALVGDFEPEPIPVASAASDQPDDQADGETDETGTATDDDATWYPDPTSATGAGASCESALTAGRGCVDGFDVDENVAVGEATTILIRLFGGVDVVGPDGAVIAFTRSKSEELLVWLSLHRGRRSTRIGARTALWSNDVRDATFANVVSDARRTLARAAVSPDGEEWLGRTLTEALPLHESIRTDADLIAVALERAQLQPPEEAIATLRPVVELVSGFPFASTTYLWPDAEGITSNLVVLATTATCELAAHCLSMGDASGVFDATARGLAVLSAHEELIGLRMRAHAMIGDLAGVRAEWDSYERAINADPWSDGEPSPKLVSLRHELLSSSAA